MYKIVNHTIHELILNRRTLQHQTQKDPILNKVLKYIEHGWPQKKDIDEKLFAFYEKRNELSYEQKILMWNNKIVIPDVFKAQVIDKLHEPHTGIVAVKSVARVSVWWPSIDCDLECTVKTCLNCNIHHPKIPESPLLLWNNVGKPWHRMHVDLAQLHGENWLFIIDSHSRWLEVFKLKHITSSNVINCFRKLFASYGICRIIVSDNGAQFTSTEFKEFCERNGVTHIKTTPYHSRSNGLAERVIRTFKTRFKKTYGQFSNQEHQLQVFLFSYRTTIHHATGSTPAKLFLNRELPTVFDRLKPDNINDVQSLKSKFYHDRTTQERNFDIGNPVWYRRGTEQTWTPAVIKDRTGPLSYRTDGDIRVHADHLREREIKDPEQLQATNFQPDDNHQSSDYLKSASQGEREQTTSLQPRRSTRNRQPPKRFHDEFSYYLN